MWMVIQYVNELIYVLTQSSQFLKKFFFSFSNFFVYVLDEKNYVL